MKTPALEAALTGRYTIERELGQGGMATVYLAQDLRHGRKVAIKVLRPELAAVIGAERFLREIRTIANLQHPHILGLIDSGEVEGTAYYVMPFVEGESLRDRLTREKQLPIADAVRLSSEVAAALDYAHRHGVIHRDIKPENVLLHDGRALVADFGIALAVSSAGSTRMTETGMSLGTPHYMSPEQAMGERDLDPRSDVYALGIMTYEMLTGEPPFNGPTAQAIIAKVMTSNAEPVTTLRATTPPAVAAAVHQAIQRLPADRFPTAAAFAAALSGTGGTTTTAAPTVATRATGTRPKSRVAALVLGVALAGLTFVAGRLTTRRADGPTVYDATLPPGAPISFAASTVTASYGISLRNLAVSRDGSFAIYAAREGDSTMIWYRSLRDATARPIVGTAGATSPRLSPDGSQIAFLRGDRAYVTSFGGGEPRLVLDGRSTASVEWLTDTELLVGDQDGNRFSRLDPGGGVPRSAAIPRCNLWSWLPKPPRLICSLGGTGLQLDPVTGARSVIQKLGSDGKPEGALQGTALRVIDGRYMVYMSWAGNLEAARYDPDRNAVGRPVLLVSGVRRDPVGEGQFDLSANGTLVFAPGVDATIGHIVRRSPGRQPEPLPIEPANFQRFDLSRDGRWFAASVQGVDGNELRVYDLKNAQRTIWLKGEYIRHPLWSTDGQDLLLSVRDTPRWSVLRGAPSSGQRPDTIFGGPYDPTSPDPVDWHDARLALAQDWSGGVTYQFDPSARGARFDTVLTNARFSSLSANGRLILHQTTDGNRIIITSFPNPGKRYQLASEGTEPLWLSPSEVLYRLGVSWFVVRVNPETGEPLGPPAFWAKDPRFSDTSGWSNRPAWDGGILYMQGPDEISASSLRVIPNWVAKMKQAVDSASR
ncbi:MAG: serine/threonine-protein kinase [Gemmatimonadales bacterium]